MTAGRKFPLYLQILGAMGLGLMLGPWLGKSAAGFGELGKVVISLIKAIATPLLFLVIVDAVLRTDLRAKSAGRLFGWAMLNASIALSIGLLLSNIFTPGQHLAALAPPADAAAYAGKKIEFAGVLNGLVPSSIVAPFAENNVLAVVFCALLFGLALRKVRGHVGAAMGGSVAVVAEILATLLRVTEVVIGWATRLIPIAVFGVVTKAVGEHGYAPLQGLAVYVAVGLLGLALHVGVTYQLWVVLFTGRSLRTFWREAKEPVIYSLGTNSSLATLPVTLKALDRLGVSKAASTLGACVGTNFNNDGILLYEGMAVLFVAQSAGMSLSLGQQLLAAVSCMIAAMGVAGVPEAGFISLALVLNTVGLPVELLPLLLTVDWVIARARSATNVLSDMLLSMLLDRGETGGAVSSPGTPDSPAA